MQLFYKVAKILLSVLVLFTILVPLSDAQVEEQLLIKTVVVIGTGAIYKGDSARAREAAVSSSLILAVDMVTVEILPIKSMVRNFKAINKIIYSQTGEFIQGYKVLAEFPAKKQYRVMVQAAVSIKVLEEKLLEAGIMVAKKVMPKTLFLVAEQHFEDNLLNYWWGKDSAFFEAISEVSMAETLTSEGFAIIDHDNVMLNNGFYTVYGKPDLNNQEVAAFGDLLQAEVVIFGKSTAFILPNIMGTNIRSFKGSVTVRAIRTDTGAEIASTTQSAVTANSDDIAGSREALSIAGALAGRELASQIAAAWQQEDQLPVMVEIVLEGTGNLANFIKFRRTLKDMPGVEEMQIKEIKSDQAIIMVSFQGSAKKLADALILKIFESIGINIYEVSENSLRIELVPG
ncbi:MAG: hypothetical protein V3S16_10150 [Candidatus Desulfatibia sp.]|uniref:hypothetical protein n=1 Tax=Candidatus Desulfatibia sp. TaxID=3101189 RepID=UPI002F2CE372